MSNAGNTKKKMRSVEVSPGAAVSMILHAVKHAHVPVHGVLLGRFDDDRDMIKVSKAVPVCHGAPTQPLLEAALALIKSTDDNNLVVGWYVSPRLEDDERPGPSALKIVAGLASDDKKKEPALVVIRNNDLNTVLLDRESSLDNSFRVLGKDFGQQWLRPLQIKFDSEDSIKTAIKKAFHEGVSVEDLIDHFETEPKKSKWFPDDSLKVLFN